MPLPFVSVIVLNYNGKHLLPDCLNSLWRQSYPHERFEVILVDNASLDGSVEMVRDKFPWVKVIRNQTNLGFGRANNVAIRQTVGDYVALLNNDAVATEGWLRELVKAAEGDPRIGICTSKILFLHNRLPLTITVEPAWFSPSHGRLMGVRLYDLELEDGQNRLEYLEGFFGEEMDGARRFRWAQEKALLGFPVRWGDKDLKLKLVFSVPHPEGKLVRLALSVAGKEVATREISGGEIAEWPLTIPQVFLEEVVPVIQNTGSIVFTDGRGRDRGAYVRDGQHINEEDKGQYEREEEVFAACGAAAIFRRAMLNEVGLFDEDFFMYYEDTDLSWRARLLGWKVMYVPSAVVRHLHCGTSLAWSPLFIYHSSLNRLAMLFKNGSWEQVIPAWTKYFAGTAKDGLRAFELLLRRCEGWRKMMGYFLLRVRICGALLLSLPRLLLKRCQIQRSRLVPQEEINAWLVKG